MQMGEPFKVGAEPESWVSGPNMQVVTGDLADAAAVEEAVAALPAR